MDNESATSAQDEKRADKTIFEEIEVAGGQLVDKIKAIIAEGNVRQVKLSAQDGDFALSLPMTVGVIAGGAIALTAPWLAILGVVAALVTKVKLEVERDPNAPAAPSARQTDEALPEPAPRPDTAPPTT